MSCDVKTTSEVVGPQDNIIKVGPSCFIFAFVCFLIIT